MDEEIQDCISKELIAAVTGSFALSFANVVVAGTLDNGQIEVIRINFVTSHCDRVDRGNNKLI